MNRTFLLAGVLALAVASPTAAAADLTAVVSATGGVLRVTGGDGADDLEIRSGSNPGDFTVTGVNGTTVNGSPAVTVTGVRRIIVNTGAGDDRVVIDDARIRADLNVLLGDGDDVLLLRHTTVRGRTAIRGGRGADRIVAESGCNFRGVFRVRSEAGDDVVTLRGSAFADDVWIDTGSASDGVVLDRASFVRGADFDLRAGPGDDALEIDDSGFDGSVDVDMGSDEDRVTIDDSEFDRDADFSGGGGNDDRLILEGGNDFRRDPEFRRFEFERT